MRKKRFLSLIIVIALMLTIPVGIPVYGESTPDSYIFDISQGDITVSPGNTDGKLKVTYDGASVVDDIMPSQEIIITGTTITNKIEVDGVSANITLNNVNIQHDTATDVCAFELLNSANVVLVLTGSSILASSGSNAGLQVETGQTITIQGDGSLMAQGGKTTIGGSLRSAAGIGGGVGGSGGNIAITDGNITALGGNNTAFSGAGIGGGSFGTSGNISISGGTIIATGGSDGAGIGGGDEAGADSIDISDGNITATGNSRGAGIGGGSGGVGGTINISGGTISATGTTGIGSGSFASGGTINISDGDITATSKGSGAGIGSGYSSAGGTVNISGGVVSATSKGKGAGIGGGEGTGIGQTGSGGIILISGGIVSAIAQSDGAGIGSGYKGEPGTVTINSEATIKASTSSNTKSVIDTVGEKLEVGSTANILMVRYSKKQTANTNTQVYNKSTSLLSTSFSPDKDYYSIAFTVPEVDVYQIKTNGQMQQHEGNTSFDVLSSGITGFNSVDIASQEQIEPTGLMGIAPTTSDNIDGKIIGTTTDMEYKISTDVEYTSVTGIEITDLVTGTYNVRYKAKEGFNVGSEATIIVPDYELILKTIELTNIFVSTKSTKLSYKEGENFDAAGMIITARYDDGTSVIVEGIVTDGNAMPIGKTEVTISYTEEGITKITTQNVIVYPESWDDFADEEWLTAEIAAGRDGSTVDNAMQIRYAADLAAFGVSVNSGDTFEGKYVKIASDVTEIDLAGHLWMPIGRGDTDEIVFRGTFDGNLANIKNMNSNSTIGFVQGLFGIVGQAGMVKNIKLTDVNISISKVNTFVGAVAGGCMGGIISNSYVDGNITGTIAQGENMSIIMVGGISGIVGGEGVREGLVEKCANYINIDMDMEIESGIFAGGIVGNILPDSTVQNCYNRGNITIKGTAMAGGIVGGNGSAKTVKYCYNAGMVTYFTVDDGISRGGQISMLNTGAVRGCYYDSGETSDTGDNGIILNMGGTIEDLYGKSTAEMKLQTTYTDIDNLTNQENAWDFTDVWQIDERLNDGYPFIKGMLTVNVDPDLICVEEDKAALVDETIKGTNTDLSNITGALENPLLAVGSANGSNITWVSGTPGVVSDNGQTVIRPAFGTGNATVTLTATITKGDITDTKTFNLTVLAETLDPDIAKVAVVKGLVSGASYAMTQAVATNEADIKAAIEDKIATLALDGVGTTVTKILYTPAIAGNAGTPTGTNGTYTFTVGLSKGAVSNTTVTLTMNIVASAYVAHSNSGGYTPPVMQPNTGADIIVNGNTVNAGTAVNTVSDDKTTTKIVVDEKKLELKLETEGNNVVVTILVKANSDIVIGELNGQMIKNMENKQAIVEVKTDAATYTLPAQQINIDAISVQMGTNVSLRDIKVIIEIANPTQEVVNLVENSAKKGEFTIVVPAVEFNVRCTYDGKTIDVSKFNAYVERTVAIPEGIDHTKITTGVIVDQDGTVRHVPTKIVIIDGIYYAKINSLTNSTYSVVWNPIEFKDVSQHWAKNTINNMGSRMVISGVGNGMFEPNRDITRAEFAAIVVRSLGLKPGTGNNAFKDVKSEDWYCKYVETAYEYGIISGYGNEKFGPMDKITREQAMTMIAKAMKLTGLKMEFKTDEVQELLAGFSDSGQSSTWANDNTAACIKAGIVSGKGSETLAPKDEITRAEVAAIIERLLQKSGLI